MQIFWRLNFVHSVEGGRKSSEINHTEPNFLEVPPEVRREQGYVYHNGMLVQRQPPEDVGMILGNGVEISFGNDRPAVNAQYALVPTDNWLLTAYEKKEKSVSASSTDIETEPGGKRNGTATPQNGLSESKLQTAAFKPHGLASERKVTNSASDKQGHGEKVRWKLQSPRANALLMVIRLHMIM